MIDFQFVSDQQQTADIEFVFEEMIVPMIPVLAVADDRMPQVLQVPPNLMRPPGERNRLHQRVTARRVLAG